jgi:peroxiredoxin
MIHALLGRSRLALLWLFVGVAPVGGGTDRIQVSVERLKTIHKALVAYESKHKQWPDHLSDLVPEFLPDRNALVDPADPGTGDLGSTEAHRDPKFHVSYSYERSVDHSQGLPAPLGPFPKSDLADPRFFWGSWRLVNGHQEHFFGDQVPLVRCFLHRPPEEDRKPGKDLVLNLTPSGRVYRSDFGWDKHPDSVAFVLWTLRRDLTQGAPNLCRRWTLGRVAEYFGPSGELFDARRHGELMRALAAELLAARDQLPEAQRAACQITAVLYLKLGQFEQTLQALDIGSKYQGAKWSPIVEDQVRAEAYRGLKRWDSVIGTYERMLRQAPNVRAYMEGLAEAYTATGNAAKAEDWRRKADPGMQLVGRPAPDFRVPLLDGGILTLADARRGKKALLLNFWFCSCQPCRLEFPHLEQLYETYNDQGLAVLAINPVDDPPAIRKFLGQKYKFPIGLGRDAERRANPICDAYHVATYPTSYLIDAEGRVLWRGVGFGSDWKRELPAALAKAGLGK